tara:strand:+ start:331 stop:507 length:177 start_codon:yes stop_codon:yes gene_type:complete
MADGAVIAAVVLLSVVCLTSAYTVLRLLIPDPRQRARLRAERIERLFRDEGTSEVADA